MPVVNQLCATTVSHTDWRSLITNDSYFKINAAAMLSTVGNRCGTCHGKAGNTIPGPVMLSHALRGS
jgi:hypothetical protein